MSIEVSRPKNFGVVLFPGFQALDAFGPLDVLNTLSHSHPIELSILAASLDPVSTETGIALAKSKCAQSVLPTHTFDSPPSDLEVVLIPGGYGVIDEKSAAPVVAFVKSIYPSLKYLITVCNGATVAARAGVLDGKRATSNKALWKEVTAPGPNVKWVPHARWVVDGNTYTSSGVSAGIDAVLAFVDDVYGEETAKNVANMLEYRRHADSNDDPFAELYGL